MTQIDLEFLTPPTDTSIPVPPAGPVPNANFLQRTLPAIPGKQTPMKETKYEKEYDAFCHWAALPKDLRKPKKVADFEKAWKLPRNYTAYFRQREDYQDRRTKYFYDWMMDLWPDVVHEAYKRAMRNSTADFKVLAEIVGKSMDTGKPKVAVTPMVLVGVAPEKLDKLFEPKPIQGEVVSDKKE